MQCPGHESGFPDLPGCASFQIFCRVSRINALLLFRGCDLFLVGKIGHLRTTSLVSPVVAGKPDHTEALDKQNQGMLALARISYVLLPELPMSSRDGTQDSSDRSAGPGIQSYELPVQLFTPLPKSLAQTAHLLPFFLLPHRETIQLSCGQWEKQVYI